MSATTRVMTPIPRILMTLKVTMMNLTILVVAVCLEETATTTTITSKTIEEQQHQQRKHFDILVAAAIVTIKMAKQKIMKVEFRQCTSGSLCVMHLYIPGNSML